ncbi:hypothetical protein MYX84_13885 [Acidobacteria bacterium AH-259-O06]|nr:hypothetical protein [Acidobacteria bacterium AH-259-O06]
MVKKLSNEELERMMQEAMRGSTDAEGRPNADRITEIFDKMEKKEELTKEEWEDLARYCSKLRLEASKIRGRESMATLVPSEIASQQAEAAAKEAGLSPLAVGVAWHAAYVKASGVTEAEYMQQRKSPEELLAIDEIKNAGLWSWKGVN